MLDSHAIDPVGSLKVYIGDAGDQQVWTTQDLLRLMVAC